jgi:transcriptional regulator with XRE-family HTH domain
MTLTGAQVREARALLGWSQDELAGRVGVSATTIAYFENDRRRPLVGRVSAMRQTLETAGVEFIAENGGGAGVRLMRKDAL